MATLEESPTAKPTTLSAAETTTTTMDIPAPNPETPRPSLTFVQSLRIYRPAILWSLALSTSIVMEGFDLILLNSLFGYPAFQRKFGEPLPTSVRSASSPTLDLPNSKYELPASWQTALSNGTLVGQMLGLFLSGVLADRFGFRRTMLFGLFLIVCFVFIPFFAPNIEVLLAGQILLGIPFGCFQALACTYASEVCSFGGTGENQLRAYLTTYTNLCWVIGQIIASGVLRGLVSREELGDWGYRIPFALQWFWPLPIAVAVVFAPESPWWFVRKGRVGEARRMVERLTTRDNNGEGEGTSFDIDEAVESMCFTDEMEKSITEGTSYLDCFRGKIDLRRTEIVCGVWALQTICGSTFMGYSSYFYQQAGLDVDNAYTMTLVQFSLGAVGTVCSWFLMSWFGRRTLYLSGQGILACLLCVIGFAALAGKENVAAQWSVGSLLLVYTLVYNCTVGPVCYALVTELSSTRLKTKSVVLARNLYNLVSIITNIITPMMLNPTAWNWGAKAGFFWAGACALCFVWTFFRVPEPKGRSYAELDILFEAGISARKFKDTVVDELLPAARHNHHQALEKDGKVVGEDDGVSETRIEHVV